MPATVRRAGTLSLTIDSVAYSCQITGFRWQYVGELITTGCSPSDGDAEVGRGGDGALWELTVDMLAEWSSGGLDLAVLTGTVGEEVAYTLLADTEGDGTWARTYSGNLKIPNLGEEWRAGEIERVQIVFPVLSRTAALYDSTP